jgi:type II secretory pathway pseudopilin PulG
MGLTPFVKSYESRLDVEPVPTVRFATAQPPYHPVVMTTSLRRLRVGYTMIELLLVVGTLAIVFALAAPRMTTIRESSTLRAGHQQLASAFAAARAAALQKGKTSTLTLSGNVATVTVLSGLAGTSVTVFGPIRLYQSLGVALEPLEGAPTVVNYNGRGMMTNVMVEDEEVFRYRLRYGTKLDTLCISTAGLILSKSCTL